MVHYILRGVLLFVKILAVKHRKRNPCNMIANFESLLIRGVGRD